MPSDCDVLLLVRAHALLANPRIAELLLEPGEGRPGRPATAEQQSFQALLNGAGVDPRRDLEQIAICLFRPNPVGGAELGSVFMAAVSGRFPEGVLPLVRQHLPDSVGVLQESVSGLTALQRDGRWLLQTPERTLLLSNQKALLAAHLKPGVADAGYGLGESRAMATLVASSRLFEEALSASPLGEALTGAKALRVEATVDVKHASLVGTLTARDKAQAERVATLARAELAAVRERARSAPAMVQHLLAPTVSLAEAVTVDRADQRVTFSLDAPAGLLEALLPETPGATP